MPIHIKLLLFYSLLFVVAICIKLLRYVKLEQPRVMINSIWFSMNGTIPDSAINNLIQLMENIDKSPYGKYYKVILWTDKKKLISKIKKTLKEKKIIIKDYRSISPLDECAKKINKWINEMVSLGDDDNKLLFAMASDMLRIYLVLKEFPVKYPKAITLYIDCNDVQLTQLPNPFQLRNITTIAFNFIANEFNTLTKNLLNNDVIIAVNKNNQEFFNEIFQAYCANLAYIDCYTNGIIEMYFKTRESMKLINDNSLCKIIFGTTHIISTLYQYGEKIEDIFLVKRIDNKLIVKQVKNIQSVYDYISFKAIREEGLTWMSNPGDGRPINYEYSEFWESFFENHICLTNTFIQSHINAN